MELARTSSPRRTRGRFARDSPPTTRASLQFEISGGDLAPAAARRIVEDVAATLDPRRLDEVRLLVSELVSNCVLHAGIGHASAVTVNLELTESSLRVAVSNPGGAFAPPAVAGTPDEPTEGGRGLMLVDRLADRWGIDEVHEARVWFEISRAAAAEA
jgi:anti-sigma regulatory factor (Ser/Thr protein kinase)